MTAAQPFAAGSHVRLTEDYWTHRGSFLASLHERYGPVVPSVLGRTPVVFVLGPEANRCVLQTRRASLSQRQGWDWLFGRPVEPPHLLTMDDPQHAIHRRILHPAFTAHRLEAHRVAIAQIVERRLATWAHRSTVDVYEEARVITLDVVATVVLGLRHAPDRALCRAVYLHGAHRLEGEWARLLEHLTAMRLAHPAHDALSLLARASDERNRPLSAAQIRAHVDVLLIAGHETSASLAAWALYLLVQHPDWADRVRAESARQKPRGTARWDGSGELTVLDAVLRESERLYPPVAVAPRVAVADVDIAGYTLPAGTRLFYSAAATHLLPGCWTDPLTFDPHRFAQPRKEHLRHPFALVGFGGGARTCIGRSLARLELALLLSTALRRYHLTLSPHQVVVQRSGVTSRPAHGIRLDVTRR